MDHSFIRIVGMNDSNSLYIAFILFEQLFLYLYRNDPICFRFDIEANFNGNVGNMNHLKISHLKALKLYLKTRLKSPKKNCLMGVNHGL